MPYSRRFPLAVTVLAVLCLALPTFAAARATDLPATIPISQIKPGMKGIAYTIYEGDQVEPINLVVLGVMKDALGPKQDVILVKLLGEKAQEDGVVAGMSGSPVYFDGKLAGALSLKLGVFTKDAIGGVTPIANMLDVSKEAAASKKAFVNATPGKVVRDVSTQVPVSSDFTQFTSAGAAGQFLVPIETPLITSGIYPQALAQFKKQFSSWGVAAMAGGTAPASPTDKNLKPGDMVGIDLIRGDFSMASGCTVTTVVANQILACGHPLFGYGSVNFPISRAHVILTLASAMASTKVMSTGGVIGTLTQDRRTAIMGTLGPGPSMIPMDVDLATPAGTQSFHLQVVENRQLTPLLVAVAAYNSIVGTPAYSEGTTLQLAGSIQIKDHTPVKMDDLFSPTDVPIQSGMMVALAVEGAFSRIYSNPYESPDIQGIHLHVTTMAERRWARIENAWVGKSEVHPGETLDVKVLLRPYRGAPVLREIPVRIPEEVTRGKLQLVVSDADWVNRNLEIVTATSDGQLPGLEELIRLVNRTRQNDRLYATLLQPTPTLLVEDKELPNAPVSEINVLNQRQNPGDTRLLWQSTAGEWSVEMHQVISGEHALTITVK
jgi:SpoIVB peptidase S55